QKELASGHKGTVHGLAFSPASSLLASASWGDTVGFLRVATGKAEAPLTGIKEGCSGVAFSPDARTLAVDCEDGTVRLWNPASKLLPLVYDELRQLAARKMTRESCAQTLQPTALVHEAWLRLGGDEQPTWENRTHFFCAAAEAMRRILIDRARRKQAVRHGGGQQRLDVDEVEIAAPMKDDELLAVNEALDRFSQHAPQKAELVKLRYFAGFGLKEAGQV